MDVAYEHEQFNTAFSRRKTTEPLAADISPLADEASRQAISALEKALELMKAGRNDDRTGIEPELTDSQNEIDQLKHGETHVDETYPRSRVITRTEELLH